MSEECLAYGCIVANSGSLPKRHEVFRLNQAVIDALPIKDTYPPVSRGIFAVPMDYGEAGSAFYRQQVIHFGASFSHMSEFWHEWIAKFEELLRSLHWLEARVHLDIELYGSYEYRWNASWEADEIPWQCVPPKPTTRWLFQGGPRDFRTPN